MTTQSIVIPKKLEQLLDKDKKLHGYVVSQLDRFTPLLKASGTPFFPEYTDHGVDHLTRVLNTAEWLIADEAKKALTPEDAACLILAVLLHDLAMHLTPDLLFSLVSKDADPVFPMLDRGSWKHLWEEYLLETKHWTEQKWRQIAGDNYQNKLRVFLGQVYELDLTKLQIPEYPLVGEFIRRYHGRLAHEIAVDGLPALLDKKPLCFDPSHPASLLDLAGLVARSHTIAIRDTFIYLDKKYDKRKMEISGLHAVFLMAVLRIADYLDLYAERASGSLRKTKVFHNPTSRGEWDAHEDIQDIEYDNGGDPEKVEIIAKPRNAQTYQKILSWVNGIQAELDQSWAVLGEIFGRHVRLSCLKLRLRRISTPLSETHYVEEKNLSYSPELTRFTVDGQKIIELLVGPLYGNKPKIAVRELTQNAVDAVREADMKYTTSELRKNIYPVLEKMEADIVIKLGQREKAAEKNIDNKPEDWQYWLEVVDRGLGMTEEVVRQYFLKAGSSLRHSARYDELFSQDEQTKIFRTGRFGIGVLAVFLAGETMHVTTRTREMKHGLRFTCGILAEEIEITYDDDVPVGTRICVKLSKDVYDRLSSLPEDLFEVEDSESYFSDLRSRQNLDWYVLPDPKVSIIQEVMAKSYPIQRALSIPYPDQPSEWRHIESGEEKYSIQWIPSNRLLMINGIYISRNAFDYEEQLSPEVRYIKISVLDATERIPLNILRDELSGEFPYREVLVRDLALDQLARLFLEADVIKDSDGFDTTFWNPFERPDFEKFPLLLRTHYAAYGISSKGIIPLTRWHLANAALKQLCFVSHDLQAMGFNHSFAAAAHDVPVFFVQFDTTGFDNEKEMRELLTNGLLRPTDCGFFTTKDFSILIPKNMLRRLDRSVIKELNVQGSGDLIAFHSHTPVAFDPALEASFLDVLKAAKKHLRESHHVIGLLRLEIEPIKDDLTPGEKALSDLWQAFKLPPFIPWDRAKRKLLLNDQLRARMTQIVEYPINDLEFALTDEEDLRYLKIERWW